MVIDSPEALDFILRKTYMPYFICLNETGQVERIGLPDTSDYPTPVEAQGVRERIKPQALTCYNGDIFTRAMSGYLDGNRVVITYYITQWSDDLKVKWQKIIYTSRRPNDIQYTYSLNLDACGHLYMARDFKDFVRIDDYISEAPGNLDIFIAKFRRQGTLYLPGDESRPPSNHDAHDGSLRIIAAEGEQPYTYAWSHTPDLNAPEAKDLAPGVYQVTVTDARGCKQMAHFSLKERPVQFRNLITRPTTNGLDNGEIRMSAYGGQPPYEYSIDDGMTWLSDRKFKDLAAGTYQAAIRDASGTEVRVEVEIRPR